MKRRSFLARSLATGATPTVLPAGVRAGTRRNPALTLARVGCGRMGRGDMRNALAIGAKESVNARLNVPMREPYAL